MNEHPQPACSTSDHSQAPVIDTTKPHSERSAKSSTVPTKRRLSATGRLGLTRPLVSVVACVATLLGVSACGSSTPQVSQALKSRVERTIENADPALKAAKVTEVTDCLVPTLTAHGITTLAAAKAYGNTSPSWLRSATVACLKQTGLTSLSTSGRSHAVASSSSGVTDTEPADAKTCGNLRQAFVTLHADQSQTNLDAFTAATIPNASMTQTLYNAFQALNGDVEDGLLSGSEDPTSQADEQAVATGCAAAGVKMPSGFTA